MIIDEKKTRVLRTKRRALSVMSVVLHPMLMPFYVSCLLSAAFFPFSFFSQTNWMMLVFFLFCTFVLPVATGAIIFKTQHMKNFWRLDRTEHRQLITILYAIFFATAFFFYRRIFFLPYMYGSLVICTLLMIVSLLFEKRTRMDNHVAGLVFAATYIYCYCLRFGVGLLHVVAVIVILAGVFVYLALECHSATLKSVAAGAVSALVLTVATFLIL